MTSSYIHNSTQVANLELSITTESNTTDTSLFLSNKMVTVPYIRSVSLMLGNVQLQVGKCVDSEVFLIRIYGRAPSLEVVVIGSARGDIVLKRNTDSVKQKFEWASSAPSHSSFIHLTIFSTKLFLYIFALNGLP
jgi:hypothetical protein